MSDSSHDRDTEETSGLSDEDIKALEQERDLMSESFVDMGERLLEQALPSAIQSVINLAEKGGTDTIRFKAAQYIIDRQLGPVTATHSGDSHKSAADRLLEDITVAIPLGLTEGEPDGK